MDWFNDLQPHWSWLALGLFLAVAEMAIPGVFLIWLAGAAIVTGLLTWVLPIGLPLQIVIFAVLAIVAVFTGKRYLHDNPIVPADPKMNRRGARMVGEIARVTEAIEAGQGRVHYGDSEWIARGPDVDEGDRVRIVGSEGSVLLVEPLAAQPAADA
jgi:membrane protein implicated in regulation of membrane protease activity